MFKKSVRRVAWPALVLILAAVIAFILNGWAGTGMDGFALKHCGL